MTLVGKKKFSALTSLVLTFSLLGAAAPSSAEEGDYPPFETEVIVRTVNQFKDKADVRDFMELAERHGVDVISMNVKQDEDDEAPSGQVFYRSKIAPVAEGYEDFDALREVVAQAHAAGIKVNAWIPQFHDQEAFLQNEDWQMQALEDGVRVPFTGSNGSEYFVNPLNREVQRYERSIVREVVENYSVDGVVLDWIRFDDYNMDVSDYTIAEYKAQFGYSPLDIDFAKDSVRRKQWNEWRADRIGQYVRDVRRDLEASSNPDVRLGVYVLPPQFAEVGQNVAKFKSYVDFIAPMAYFDDWGYDGEWVYGDRSGILKDVRNRLAGTQARIVPTLDQDWTDEDYQEIYAGIRRNYPEVERLSFFAYGAWTEDELAAIDERTGWPASGEQDYDAKLPAAWSARNIGSMPGTAAYQSSKKHFTLGGSSTDVWGESDRLNFVYRPIAGNAEMVVQVKSLSRLDDWAKAGLSIRESLAADARHVDMVLTPENGASFQYRTEKGGETADRTAGASSSAWLKLSRSGDTFVGFVSGDGRSWTRVGSIRVPMNDRAYIGLALSNPGEDSKGKAVFGSAKATP
ncbi:putative glycoside hydrolase [Saccharibacillus sp. CPCC 101409]|uniref:putative glycoside hydrolase n=1 Tax=Saccharibacillus sp. CPCC 101409 TaxID=3058041 RepID=UPI002673704C|nr:putative glycoside hydrolase [Saccharibacillus sp. CPCC 101409]MDO3409757.1 putative glycoside hydrolase [Saccharibacillus sp. CPCC 101409]